MNEKKIKENLREELDGFSNYYSLYIENIGIEIGYDFYQMACDEFKHCKFWYELAKVLDIELGNIDYEYKEFEKLLNNEGEFIYE